MLSINGQKLLKMARHGISSIDFSLVVGVEPKLLQSNFILYSILAFYLDFDLGSRQTEIGYHLNLDPFHELKRVGIY